MNSELFSLSILTLITLVHPSFRKLFFFKKQDKKDITLKKRNDFFDFIKGISIIAVIIIHIGYLFESYKILSDNTIVDFINNLFRFAVPVFFISSGVLLQPISNNYFNFYFKKITRIVIPYILIASWSFIFLTPNSNYFYALISGKISTPYYFIIILLQLYTIYPFLNIFRHSHYFLIFSFIFSFGCYLNSSLWSFYGIPFFGKYLFFFFYGIYTREHFLNYKKHINKTQLYYWLLVIVLYIAIFCILPDRYYNVRFFYSIAIFNLLFYFKYKIIKFHKITNFFISFGKISLWIFLLHFDILVIFFLIFKDRNINISLIYFIILGLGILTSYLVASYIDKLHTNIKSPNNKAL